MNVPESMGAPQIQTNDLGYEACLDRGLVALESGVTNVALSYLGRAAELRPTRFALLQLAKAHRDLGQFEAGRNRLEQARSLPDGHSDGYVLVSLAAILCDLQDYGPAMEVAKQAVKADPKNPAALKVAERSLREPALALSRSKDIDPNAIAKVQEHADDLGRRAAEVEPNDGGALLERRRERATQGWLLSADSASSQISVEQEPAALMQQEDRGRSESPGPELSDESNSSVSQSSENSWWQRILLFFRS